MKEQRIACMYYPTTVIAVDDNPAVLESVQLKVGKIAPCKTFLVPEEALDYIRKEIDLNKSLDEIISVDKDSVSYSYDSEQLPLQYDITKIHNNIYNRSRFSEISLAIVDYAMPSMNGEDFCRRLKQMKGSNIKIIMLTGEADDPKAIQLFNAGIIDHFMRKAQEDVEEDLKNCVIEMQSNYFKDTTYPIFQRLSSEEESSLGDPEFIKFFNKVCRDISATSYYLIEMSGSFIFFNNAGKPTWLIIKTLRELEEISEQIEPHISEELIDAIGKGEVVPYFGDDRIGCYSDEKKLRQSLHKAQKLVGKQEYRYALLDDLPEFSLKTNEIVSFNKYIGSL